LLTDGWEWLVRTSPCFRTLADRVTPRGSLILPPLARSSSPWFFFFGTVGWFVFSLLAVCLFGVLSRCVLIVSRRTYAL